MLRSFPYNKLILNYFGKINVCWHAAAYRLNEPSTARQDANLRAECQKGIRVILWAVPRAASGTRKGPLGRRKANDILDASCLVQKQFPALVDGAAPTDEGFQGFWPLFHENTQIRDGRTKGLPVCIDRANDHLILEDNVAHDQISIDFDGGLGGGVSR